MERVSGETVWRQIERELSGDIRNEQLKPGDRLPTEMQLAKRFAVNRHTVRRALSSLADAGLIRIEQGRGSFVQETVLDYPLTSRTRFSQIVTAHARIPSHEILRAEVITADKRIAENLGIGKRAKVVVLEDIGLIDDRPSTRGIHYFPADRFAGLIELYEDTKSISKSLEALGVGDFRRKTTRIQAVMPTSEDVHLLKCARNRPLLETEAVNVDPDGVPVEFGIARFVSDRVQLVVES